MHSPHGGVLTPNFPSYRRSTLVLGLQCHAGNQPWMLSLDPDLLMILETPSPLYKVLFK